MSLESIAGEVGQLLSGVSEQTIIHYTKKSHVPDKWIDLTRNGLSLKINFLVQDMKINCWLPMCYWNITSC